MEFFLLDRNKRRLGPGSKWGTLRIDLNLREPFGVTYQQMFSMPRWHADLRNAFIFTTLFLTGSISFGLVLAMLLDRKLLGHTILRNVFLFPYALSFIVTGIVGAVPRLVIHNLAGDHRPPTIRARNAR